MFLVAVYNNSFVRYDVDEQWNVLFLKQRVCQDLKINPDVHFLSCETQQGFRIMKEETKLIDYGLMSDCHIYVYMRPPRNQYFIFCYACENIRAATVTFNCSVCNSVFVPFKCDTNSLKCNGKCLSDFCVSNEAFVRLSCPVSPTHESKVFLRHIKQNVGRVDCAACASSEMEILISFCDDEITHSVLSVLRSMQQNIFMAECSSLLMTPDTLLVALLGALIHSSLIRITFAFWVLNFIQPIKSIQQKGT
ncbi:unnamed protein product [Heterobilharzia americana]|nr:unnamed protein product [Heterobilharzia americana]